jgi:bacillithiol biosynthesis cysteine-adding enzyme BshC
MIETIALSRKNLNLFSNEELDLIYNQSELQDLIGLPFSSANIKNQIDLKKESFDQTKRALISKTLEENYREIDNKEAVTKNINLLKENSTFTITTGHQICLYGGPLYFFIKILHVIKLCEKLKEQYPSNHFVPVFWMASEDHDSLEIESLSVFNKTLTWDHKQEGAVGEYSTQNISTVQNELLELFRGEKEIECYLKAMKGDNYGDAFRSWLHYIFGDRGLVVLDANQKELKSTMKPHFTKELVEQFSNQCIENTNTLLKSKNRKPQIHSREINLFYMHGGERKRIVKEKDTYLLGNLKLRENELLELVDKAPERFSPNVALRPLYQEVILPNLCYVGGMAELKYWTQLKNIFKRSSIPYPMLQMRSNILWIDKASSKTIYQVGFRPDDLLQSRTALEKQVINKADPNPIDKITIEKHQASIRELYHNAILQDNGMKSWIGAELNKLDKLNHALQVKIEKAKKNSFESQVKKISKLKERLFPKQKLQERSVNLLHFCNQAGPKQRIADLYNALNPLSTDFTIIIENETK